MKRRMMAIVVATIMVLSSVLTAFATESTVADGVTLAVDSYTEYDNPLQGNVSDTVIITYTINWADEAAMNGWDGIFSFYDASSTGRVSFQTAPYLCYNSGTGEYVDIKNDAWCSSNCEKGTDYTFVYTITADSITVTCDGAGVDLSVTGSSEDWDGSYQCILDAINTYPTLTVGVGQAVSSYWYTEICTVSISMSTGSEASTSAAASDSSDSSSDSTTVAVEETTTEEETTTSVADVVAAVSGSVTLADGTEIEIYDSAEEAEEAGASKYIVKSVVADDDATLTDASIEELVGTPSDASLIYTVGAYMELTAVGLEDSDYPLTIEFSGLSGVTADNFVTVLHAPNGTWQEETNATSTDADGGLVVTVSGIESLSPFAFIVTASASTTADDETTTVVADGGSDGTTVADGSSDGSSSTVKTGDVSTYVYVLCLVCAAAAVIVVSKKKITE